MIHYTFWLRSHISLYLFKITHHHWPTTNQWLYISKSIMHSKHYAPTIMHCHLWNYFPLKILKNLPVPKNFRFFPKKVQMLKSFSEVCDITFKRGKIWIFQAWKMCYFYWTLRYTYVSCWSKGSLKKVKLLRA